MRYSCERLVNCVWIPSLRTIYIKLVPHRIRGRHGVGIAERRRGGIAWSEVEGMRWDGVGWIDDSLHHSLWCQQFHSAGNSALADWSMETDASEKLSNILATPHSFALYWFAQASFFQPLTQQEELQRAKDPTIPLQKRYHELSLRLHQEVFL